MIGREKLGMNRPLNIGILTKITDRVSRSTELTKKCVTDDEFTAELAAGNIIASYTLESNGKRYGSSWYNGWYHQYQPLPASCSEADSKARLT